MEMNMTSPCKTCPFRTDVTPFLNAERVEEITNALLNDRSFSCHSSNEFDDDGKVTKEAEHCAGAVIFLEKQGRCNQWMRWMERLGMYDHTKMKMDSPVFDCAEDMIEAQPF